MHGSLGRKVLFRKHVLVTVFGVGDVPYRAIVWCIFVNNDEGICFAFGVKKVAEIIVGYSVKLRTVVDCDYVLWIPKPSVRAVVEAVLCYPHHRISQ